MQKLTQAIYWDCQPLSVLGLPLGRNEVVIQLRERDLFLHSPLGLTPARRAELEKLGTVRWVLLPSRFHTNFYEDYFQVFPDAYFIGMPSVLQEFKFQPRHFVSVETAAKMLAAQIDFFPIAGMPRVDEVAAFHRSSGSLLVADLVFNLPPAPALLDRMRIRLAGMHHGVKASRLFKLMIKDRTAFSQSLRRILELPLHRVLLAHGSFLEHNARNALQQAFDGVLVPEASAHHPSS
jgi:hypothetical protein